MAHNLASRAPAVRFDHRKKLDARPGVVVPIQPGDRQGMRGLPQKQDGKEHPGPEAQLAPSRSPANDRRQCAGNRPHEAAKRGLALEGRVEKEVTPHADGRHEGTEDVHEESQVQKASPSDRHAEDQRLGGLKPPIGQRPKSRALHPCIHIPLDILIQRERPPRRESHAQKGVDQPDIVCHPRGSHVESNDRRDQHHHDHTGPRQRQKVGYLSLYASHFDVPRSVPSAMRAPPPICLPEGRGRIAEPPLGCETAVVDRREESAQGTWPASAPRWRRAPW